MTEMTERREKLEKQNYFIDGLISELYSNDKQHQEEILLNEKLSDKLLRLNIEEAYSTLRIYSIDNYLKLIRNEREIVNTKINENSIYKSLFIDNIVINEEIISGESKNTEILKGKLLLKEFENGYATFDDSFKSIVCDTKTKFEYSTSSDSRDNWFILSNL